MANLSLLSDVNNLVSLCLIPLFHVEFVFELSPLENKEHRHVTVSYDTCYTSPQPGIKSPGQK